MRFSWSCMLAVLLLAGPAHAAGFVQFDVPRQGGAYTVDVLPGAVTVLRFPAEVLVAYTAQRHPALRGPAASTRGHGGDRELEETFQERVAQEAQRELDRRWSEARAELQRDLAAIERSKAELAEQQARLQALIRQATMQGIADGIRARRRSVAMGGMARERHVLVRIAPARRRSPRHHHGRLPAASRGRRGVRAQRLGLAYGPDLHGGAAGHHRSARLLP